MLLDEILRELTCCLNKDQHIVEEPIQICECGANACKNCLIQTISESINCTICNRVHDKNSLLKWPVSKASKRLIEAYSEEIIKNLDSKIRALKGKYFRN